MPNKYKIIIPITWLLSNCSFFTIITLLWLRGRLLDAEFTGTQLLPSSLNCKPLAAAWAIIDWRSWIEFFEGILAEILTPQAFVFTILHRIVPDNPCESISFWEFIRIKIHPMTHSHPIKVRLARWRRNKHQSLLQNTK